LLLPFCGCCRCCSLSGLSRSPAAAGLCRLRSRRLYLLLWPLCFFFFLFFFFFFFFFLEIRLGNGLVLALRRQRPRDGELLPLEVPPERRRRRADDVARQRAVPLPLEVPRLGQQRGLPGGGGELLALVGVGGAAGVLGAAVESISLGRSRSRSRRLRKMNSRRRRRPAFAMLHFAWLDFSLQLPFSSTHFFPLGSSCRSYRGH